MATHSLKMAESEDPAGRITSRSQINQASGKSRLANWFFKPVLAPMLQQRSLLIILAGLGALQIGLTAAGGQAWQCPIYAFSGMPCPGCGMSRATLLLAQGQWGAAMHMHAFAPVVLAAVIVFAITGFLPRKHLPGILSSIATVERHTGLVTFLALSMLIYWGLRVTGVIEYIPGF
jgi:hypothetical protein